MKPKIVQIKLKVGRFYISVLTFENYVESIINEHNLFLKEFDKL